MENVAEKQETLYNLLTELENVKTEEEIDRLRAEVQALKEKSDAALVLLHVSMILLFSVVIMSYSLSDGNTLVYHLRILFNCHIFDEYDKFFPYYSDIVQDKPRTTICTQRFGGSSQAHRGRHLGSQKESHVAGGSHGDTVWKSPAQSKGYFYCQISFTRNKTDESGWFKYFSANQDKTNLVKCQR